MLVVFKRWDFRDTRTLPKNKTKELHVKDERRKPGGFGGFVSFTPQKLKQKKNNGPVKLLDLKLASTTTSYKADFILLPANSKVPKVCYKGFIPRIQKNILRLDISMYLDECFCQAGYVVKPVTCLCCVLFVVFWFQVGLACAPYLQFIFASVCLILVDV